jgi:hypothetical protein
MRVRVWPCLIGSVAVRVVLSGCILTPGEECEWMVRELPVDSILAISDTVALGQPVPFEVLCWTTDCCTEFAYIVITAEALDVYLTVFGKRRRREMCCTAGHPITVRGQYTPSAAGIYAFHFTRPQQSSIDTTVVIR